MTGGMVITEASCPKCGNLVIYPSTDTYYICRECRRKMREKMDAIKANKQ